MWLLCGLILSLSISCEASSSLELLEVIVEVANVDCFRLLVKEVEESDGLLGGMAALVDLQGGTIKQAWTLGTKEEWRIHTGENFFFQLQSSEMFASLGLARCPLSQRASPEWQPEQQYHPCRWC